MAVPTAPPAPASAPVSTRVLVLGMTHADGTLHAAEVYPVAEACGLSREQVRSCLRRLVADGLFRREGNGRAAVYRATERGLAALELKLGRMRLAWRQDRAPEAAGWDGHWHLVGFAVPERSRAARDALRSTLRALGGAPLQSGLYVSPHAWEGDVRAAAKRLGVEGSLMLLSTAELEAGGLRDPRLLAERLWPLAELAGRYERFLATWSGTPESLSALAGRRERLPDAAFLPGALAMAVAFAECFDGDPLLPPELLPPDWPGGRARAVLLESRRLALAIREAQGRPAPFRLFDETVGAAAAPATPPPPPTGRQAARSAARSEPEASGGRAPDRMAARSAARSEPKASGGRAPDPDGEESPA